MTPDNRHRRRGGAQRDHVVPRLGSYRPMSVGADRADRPRASGSEHRRSLQLTGTSSTANRACRKPFHVHWLVAVSRAVRDELRERHVEQLSWTDDMMLRAE